MKKPNFFIVGAPKCGTTAMSEYLRSHPNVFMSDPKEPCFFSRDVGPSIYRSTDEYLDLFNRATPSQSVVAEASTQYIYSRHALSNIRVFQPSAKLMVMLRRPAELVYAFHGQMFKQGYESERDFETAWGLQQTRAAGRSLPPGCKDAHLLQYKWIGSLGSQMENLFRLFPKEQIHVTFFEDFAADTAREYRRLLSFLELPDDDRRDFPRINEAVQYKWPWLGQFPQRMRRSVAMPLAALRRKTGFQGTGILKMLNHLNAETRPRPPLRPEFHCHLEEVFSDEVKLLEGLLGRDLSAWRSEPVDSLRQ